MKRKQGASKTIKCEICGQEVKARGYNGHLRLQHKLQLEVVTQVVTPVENVSDSSDDLSPVKLISEMREFRPVQADENIVKVRGQQSWVDQVNTPEWEAKWEAVWQRVEELSRQHWERFKAMQEKYGWAHHFEHYHLLKRKHEPDWVPSKPDYHEPWRLDRK